MAPGASAAGNIGAARDPLRLMAGATFLLASGGSVVFTLLAKLQEKVGFDDWGLGVIAGSYFVAVLIGQLALSRFADAGHARLLLGLGALLISGSLVWFAFAETLTQLIGARVLNGLAIGMWEPAARSVVTAGRSSEAGRRLGLMTSASVGGIVFGPLAGAFLATTGSLELPYLVFAGIALVVVGIVATAPVSLRAAAGTDGANQVRLRVLLRRPQVRHATVLAVALLLPIGMYEAVWARYMAEFSSSEWLVGVSVALYGLPFLAASPFGGILGDRVGALRVASIGVFVMAGVVLVMGFMPNAPLLIIVGMLEGTINAIALPNVFAAMARVTAPNEQASGQGLASGSGTAAGGIVAGLAGWVFGWGGPAATFGFTAALSAGLGLVAWMMWDGREPSVDGYSADAADSSAAEVVPGFGF